LPFTAATLKPPLACCIGAFVAQEFSAPLAEENAGLAAITQAANSKTKTSIRETLLVMFIPILPGWLLDKCILVKVS
jgi:hypothetical protein